MVSTVRKVRKQKRQQAVHQVGCLSGEIDDESIGTASPTDGQAVAARSSKLKQQVVGFGVGVHWAVGNGPALRTPYRVARLVKSRYTTCSGPVRGSRYPRRETSWQHLFDG